MSTFALYRFLRPVSPTEVDAGSGFSLAVFGLNGQAAFSHCILSVTIDLSIRYADGVANCIGGYLMNEQLEAQERQWPGDVLERKPYADFLTAYLISKVKDKDGKDTKSFTLALDAQWGQGKTFFVTNWAKDLGNANPPYPTLIFDAWNADYAADPLVAFMAAFKSALDQRINEAGLTAKLKKKAAKHVSAAVNGFRRAILPAGKQLAKGLLQKATGIATDEIFEAYKNGADAVSKSLDDEMVTKASLEAVNKGLDEFFDKLLEEQAERQKAIHEFKAAIEASLEDLVNHDAATLPMFVFIDELDRCRPSFAIALLEGVKHLFGVPGVCFVISTNMSQLSESIKAVYGQGFDGYGYLKRFFDVEYALPDAPGHRYAKLLLNGYPELTNADLSLGLPHRGFGSIKEKMEPHHAMSWIAEVFDLDLRSQRKILEMVAAAAAGVPRGKKIYFLWLCILCAGRHRSPEALELLAASRGGAKEFDTFWERTAISDSNRQIHTPPNMHNREGRTRTFQLKDVARHYYESMFKDLKELSERRSSLGQNDYPTSVLFDIAAEMPNEYYPEQHYRPSLDTYFQLVRNAGHLLTL